MLYYQKIIQNSYTPWSLPSVELSFFQINKSTGGVINKAHVDFNDNDLFESFFMLTPPILLFYLKAEK